MSMRLGLRLNTRIAAPTQYALPFNSLAYADGQVLGGSVHGLCRMGGDEDLVDTTGTLLLNPSPVVSKVKLVTTDFGSYNYKRFRWIQVGYESEDDLQLTVIANQDDSDGETYILPALGTDRSQVGQRIPIHRTLVGRYFEIEINNPNGCHFTLDSITASLTILPQKPRG